MGNRAIITTQENFENNGVGVYLHWNDGRDSVEAFLKYCKLREFRPPETDCYGWARLCQVIGNFFGGTNSIGIDTLDNLGAADWDNGTYIIKDWEIVDRKSFLREEQACYPIEQMLYEINNAQPERDRIEL